MHSLLKVIFKAPNLVRTSYFFGNLEEEKVLESSNINEVIKTIQFFNGPTRTNVEEDKSHLLCPCLHQHIGSNPSIPLFVF